MLLALEIPVKHILEFIPLTDLTFGLAHLFLKDFPEAAVYRDSYRGCLLDNSMYELGTPLQIGDLLKAADLAQPLAVIAPDWMDDYEKTMLATLELIKFRPRGAKWTVGGVVQGPEYFTRRKCYQEMKAQHISPICFPFRTERDITIKGLMQDGLLDKRQWYHLLGMRELNEMSWRHPGYWSIDTSKPFKGFVLAGEEIRGRGQLNLMSELNVTQRRYAHMNIAILRRHAMEPELTALNRRLEHVR